VVEVTGARAISPNGERWQVELLSEAAVRQPLWADIGPASRERRFFTYGLWSRAAGLRRLPVNPMLGDQSGHPSLAPLITALQGCPPLPFPRDDLLELWLLGSDDGQPLALVMALVPSAPPALPYPPGWRVGRAEPAAAASGLDPHAVAAIEAQVHRAAGSPARAQWFLRDEAGAGTGLEGFPLGGGEEGQTLPREAFPELLLREAWDQPRERELVARLIAWQAPRLLTLPGLSRATRERLEPLAARQPLALYPLRRLLPEVIDRAVVEAALVRAVLQASA
jgi:hypothetical protein